MHTFTLKGLSRAVMKKTETETGKGFTIEPNGFETADVELTIDCETLARPLGHKAMKSKSGRSSLAHGKIKARVSNRLRTYGG